MIKITCYSNGEMEFFAILEANKIRLFTGEKLIREIGITDKIDSVVFDGKSYIYVEEDSNTRTVSKFLVKTSVFEFETRQ